jgi:outer membrane lipoprotein-sorting protein
MRRVSALFVGLLFSCVAVSAYAAQQQINVGLKDVIDTVEQTFTPGTNGLAPVEDFTADFFQRTQLKKEARDMRGDGMVSVKLSSAKSPLMYRFQYYRPYPQEIVSDARSLWIYHPENREVIVSDVSFLYNRTDFTPNRSRAVNFLDGLGSISKDFHINFAAGRNDVAGNYVLELTPRRSMLNTRRIYLVVSRKSVLARVTGCVPDKTSSSQLGSTLPSTRTPFGTPAPFAGMPAFGGPSAKTSDKQCEWMPDPIPILSTTVEDQEENSTTMEFANVRTNAGLTAAAFTFAVPPGIQVVRPSEQNQPR